MSIREITGRFHYMADMADFLPLAQLVYSPFTFLLNYPYVMTESELAA